MHKPRHLAQGVVVLAKAHVRQLQHQRPQLLPPRQILKSIVLKSMNPQIYEVYILYVSCSISVHSSCHPDKSSNL